MALFRSLGMDTSESEEAEYDPRHLSSPQVFLLSMLVFLAISGFVAAILNRQIASAFYTNPGLNGLILGVLFVGIAYTFLQALSIGPAASWLRRFQSADPQEKLPAPPAMIAPMASMSVS